MQLWSYSLPGDTNAVNVKLVTRHPLLQFPRQLAELLLPFGKHLQSGFFLFVTIDVGSQGAMGAPNAWRGVDSQATGMDSVELGWVFP